VKQEQKAEQTPEHKNDRRGRRDVLKRRQRQRGGRIVHGEKILGKLEHTDIRSLRKNIKT